MNIILIIRSEIFAIFILLFLLIYNEKCSRFIEGKNHFRFMGIATLSHVIMCLVTEITVNLVDFSVRWNNIFHRMLYFTAMLFCLSFFEYVMSLVLPNDKKKLYVGSYLIMICSFAVLHIHKIEYIEGNGTMYSSGVGVAICFMVGIMLFAITDVVLIANYKKVGKRILFTILPLSIITIVFLVLQISIHEFLFSGCAITLSAIGTFFAIEDPIGFYQYRAYVDQITGTWNRNNYENDLKSIFPKKSRKNNMIFVLCDINRLKYMNDNFGHIAGDRMIEFGASILKDVMVDAYKIYRIGGDEFAVVYFGKDIEEVKIDIANVRKELADYCAHGRNKINISMGYAELEPGESMEKLISRADKAMYEDKELYHKGLMV